MLDVQIRPDPGLAETLKRHPRVSTVTQKSIEGRMQWRQGGWERSITVGDRNTEPGGLIELIDNNPIVCADRFDLPYPGATLGLIALGPLAEAGLIADEPAVVLNVPCDGDELGAYLTRLGWPSGVSVHVDPVDLRGVAAVTAVCAIRTPERLDDLDDLYDERYGRSLFVRRDETSEWDVGLVKGKPFALYRLRVSPDDPSSLLSVKVMADLDGKCGAAQVVHAFNLMCGFEESLGLEAQ